MPPETNYWFPAKRHGWGWGLPTAWQGWAVFIGFICLLALGPVIFPPRRAMAVFLAYVFVLCVALVAVCWIKGEPPRWRWGDRE